MPRWEMYAQNCKLADKPRYCGIADMFGEIELLLVPLLNWRFQSIFLFYLVEYKTARPRGVILTWHICA